jgi:predicted nucleic acid-binding protein
MIILDTSVWIAFLRKDPSIFSEVKRLLENREVLAVECIFGELLQGAKNKRERDLIVSYWNHLPKASEPDIWIAAGIYSGENGLPSKGVGLIDAVILVSANKSNSKIWTLDKRLIRILKQEAIYNPVSESKGVVNNKP